MGFKILLMSPANLVLQRMLTPELQQEAVTAENITREALKILANDNARQEIIAGYQEMRSLLGTTGVCDRVATEIFDSIDQ